MPEQKHPALILLVNLLLTAVLGAFIAGILLPVFTLEKFYIFSNTVSIWGALLQLFERREIGIFIILFCFTLLFPILKFLFLYLFWNQPRATSEGYQKALAILDKAGKWSMLDVFVIALLIVSIKLGVIAKITIHYGLYVYTASVVGLIILTWWIEKQSRVEQGQDLGSRI